METHELKRFAKDEKQPDVIIEVEGGLVQDVKLPPGLTYEVRDFDVDGCDDDEVLKDDEDREYRKSSWNSGAEG